MIDYTQIIPETADLDDLPELPDYDEPRVCPVVPVEDGCYMLPDNLDPLNFD